MTSPVCWPPGWRDSEPSTVMAPGWTRAGRGGRRGCPRRPRLGLSDPVAAWAIRQDRLVCQRVHALVEQVAADPPAWARTIVGRPDTGPERAAWERDVAVVAAYRDQHGIPDHVAQPVIPPNQGNAVLAVRRSWLRLQPSNHAVPRSDETVARLREFAARPGPDYGELLASGGYAGAPAPPARPAGATRPDATRAPPVTPRPHTRQPRCPQQRGRRLFAAVRGETVLGTGRQGTRT